MKVINGENAEPMSFNDWLRAILVSIALWVHNMAQDETADSQKTKQMKRSLAKGSLAPIAMQRLSADIVNW